MPQLIVISILLLTITFLLFKIKNMAQEVVDLKAAADAAVQKISDLKGTVATQAATITDLQAQIAAAIVPADITPITQELNDAVSAP